MNDLRNILADIGLALPVQVVYLSLLREGQATARLLSERTQMTRPSVYDQLKILRSRGLVVERLLAGKTYFAAGDPKQLQSLLEDRLETLRRSHAQLASSLPSLVKAAETVVPKIRFFEGREGVQQLLKDLLWYDDLTIHTFWPYERMLEVLGKEFLRWFNERRVKRNMRVEAVWLESDRYRPHVFEKNDLGVTRRYLALKKGKKIKNHEAAEMSYLIYGTKVAFISSTKEAYGFIVESAEFQALQKLHFDLLWQKSVSERKKRR